MSVFRRTGYRALLALTAFTAGALSACGGGGGASPAPRAAVGSVPTPPVSAAASGTVAVPYASEMLAGATYVGPASFGARNVMIQMAPQDPSALTSYAAAVNDPRSPSYRQFLTPQQIGDRFGASQSAYNATLQYFSSRGLGAVGWPQRFEIRVSGTQARLESALGAKFGTYQQGSTTFIALTSAPKLPASLHVTGVARAVDTEPQYAPILPNPEGGTTELDQSLTPQQLQNVFDFTSAYGAGYNGAGITIAVIGTGQTTPADGAVMASYYHVPVATMTYAPVSNQNVAPTACLSPGTTPASAATPTPAPGVTPGYCTNAVFTTPPTVSPYTDVQANCPSGSAPPTCIVDDGEAAQDTQDIAVLAPGAKLLFYLSYDSRSHSLADTDAELQQAIADDAADVISMSFGDCELWLNGSYEATNNYQRYAMSALAAEGVALFASVGDNAVSSGFCPQASQYAYTQSLIYPATDPNVVAAGAAYLPVNTAGQLVGQIVPWGYQDTNGCYEPPSGGGSAGNCAGSDGGCSQVFTEPSPLIPLVSPPPCPSNARAVPDIMMAGDPKSAAPVIKYAGAGGPFYGSGNGTSEAAPEGAAEWALVLQACATQPSCATSQSVHPWRLGDPKLAYYGIYAGQDLGTLTYTQVFYDITFGNNTINTGYPPPQPSGAPTYVPGFEAGPGYDLASGLGVPFARALIKAVVGI